jgi:FkbM family methyltransferase
VTISVVEAHGARYEIHNPGGLIGRPLAEGRPYEAVLLEAIHAEGFSGVAVDAGAHVGNHTMWFAAVCGLRVHAFEPTHGDRLRENVRLNDMGDRVTVHRVALGAAEGAAELVGKDRLSAGAGTIPVWPLDAYGLTDVALIKADVEDMEPEVLRGAEATIARCRPVLFLEARDAACHDAIAEVVEPWGYRCTTKFRTATPVERWAPSD